MRGHAPNETPLLTVLRDSRYIGQEGMREQAAAEIERLSAIIDGMKNRATNLAALLQSAALDAKNIPMVGHFASLTPAQQKAALEYDGPENHGDPAFAKQSDGPGNPRAEVLPSQDTVRD